MNQLLFLNARVLTMDPARPRAEARAVRGGRSTTGRVFPLPDDTLVLPGNGADTTISAAKGEYGIFASKSHPEDLHGNVTWLEA